MAQPKTSAHEAVKRLAAYGTRHNGGLRVVDDGSQGPEIKRRKEFIREMPEDVPSGDFAQRGFGDSDPRFLQHELDITKMVHDRLEKISDEVRDNKWYNNLFGGLTLAFVVGVTIVVFISFYDKYVQLVERLTKVEAAVQKDDTKSAKD